MNLAAIGKHLGMQGARVFLLIALIAASGVAVGLAVAYPLSYVEYEQSSAKRLDQAQLAGKVDVEDALVGTADLPDGWATGDPALGAFGVLGAQFCGTEVDLPTPLSSKEATVFTNDTDEATVVSQALRVDRYQSASDYLDDVRDALSECDEFYRLGPSTRIKVQVREAGGDPLITDSVSARFIDADGASVQEWSIMQVGDVLLAIQYVGPTVPPTGFLNEVTENVLIRIDPADFALGGVDTETSTTTSTTAPGGTIVGGAADESGGAGVPPAVPGAPAPTVSVP